ncbi:MAG: flagellar motor protein MotB [Thermotogaceae bacterium]|nr:flagellar motor protein MotB [Thermotogaceae bacterium]
MAKKPECPKGSPAWMTTYGDMVTLLLTFFVLLVSMSSISPGKFQQTAAGLRIALRGGPPSVLMGGKSINKEPLISAKEGVYRELIKLMADPHYKGKITIQETEEGILIVLQDMIFFDPGSARLTKQAKELLKKIGVIIIEHTANKLVIYGYTDDTPVLPTSIYASNWHLGAARAASVAKFFAEDLRKIREIERLADIRAGNFDIEFYYNPDRFIPVAVGDKAILKEKKQLDQWRETAIAIVRSKFRAGEITKSQWESKIVEINNEYNKKLQELRLKYRKIEILIENETM